MYRQRYGTTADQQKQQKQLFRCKAKKAKRYGPKQAKETPEKRDDRLKNKKMKEIEAKQKPKEEKKKVTAEIEEATSKELAAELVVVRTDFHDKENLEAHNTSEFKCTSRKEDPDFVLRRGSQFKFSVTFDRPYDRKKHDLVLVLRPGRNPTINEDLIEMFTMIENEKETANKNEWHARLIKRDGNCVQMMVHIPADCIIGHWLLEIHTISLDKGDNGTTLMYLEPRDIIILLNPWCHDDTCYLPVTELLKEYVMNPHGIVYQGSYCDIGAKPWLYGQFREGILDICLHLLRKSFGGTVCKDMANPVLIARALSAIVNNQDDCGVLAGNWSGNYEGGRCPSAWVGSVAILELYSKYCGEPVEYGQCWVYAAVLVTICRALGLPCRSVTNFNSAHDSDANVNIEIKHWLKESDNRNRDSIWNFHVWDEVWMRRPDLPVGNDGWQVIDATPQEESGGVLCCGPAPVNAVREGNCTLNYDTRFVFAEVNADVYELQQMENGEWDPVSVDTDKCGRNISTKLADGKPGKDVSTRQDITSNYKYREGSIFERRAMDNALKSSKGPKYVKDVDVSFTGLDKVPGGEDFEIEIKLKNISPSNEVRTVTKLSISLWTTTYKGKPLELVKTETLEDVTLKKNEEVKRKKKFRADDYTSKLDDKGFMEAKVTCLIKETGKNWIRRDGFCVKLPHLSVESDVEVPGLGAKFFVTLSFKNPLSKKLTNCKYSLDTESDWGDIPLRKTERDINAGEEWHEKVQLTFPEMPEFFEMVLASFQCNELPPLEGDLLI